MRAYSPEEYPELIDRLFCKPGAPYGPYERVGDPEIVVPGLLVRAELHRPGDEAMRHEASLFFGIHGFAGELWEHEVRGLLRLDALDHPALPKIVSGSFHAPDGVAFTITESLGQQLSVDDTVAWARAEPTEALDTFSVLLDALTHLHGARLLHRNLTMGALRSVRQHGEDSVSLQLTRFEMSALIGNLVRRTVLQDDEQVTRLVRRLYLTPPPGMENARHLAYLAPETLDFLLGERASRQRDWETTDVFGMGVLGWEWFCGPIPELLPDAYEAAQAAEGPALSVALARLRREMRSHLTGRFDLPKPLTTLLQDMLDEAPGGRPTSFQASRRLEQNWDGIRQLWEKAEDEETPRLVAFMPDQSVETIFELRKWISHSPETPAGREELKNFYVRELRKAELVWSPTGAVGYATDDTEKLEEARWVLIGEQAVWFCAYLYDEDLVSRRRGERHEDTLVIKYLKDRNHAHALVQARPRRKVGRIEVVPFYPGQSLAHVRRNRPSWLPLTDQVERTRRRTPGEQEFLRSIDFLLKYQRAALDARKYPFTRIDLAEDPGSAVLTFDEHRDAEWRHRNPLLTAYSADPKRRPRLSDFVENLDSEAEYITLDVVGGRQKGPYFGRNRIRVDFVERRDGDTIVVRPHKGQVVPSVGWLRPAEDGGAEPQMSRQSQARTMLESQAALIRSLREPIAYDLGRGRWTTGEGEHLEGDAPDRINDMLALHPFYALQGPPGTGKTTVAAHALRRFLKEEPGARVLVSAQSNYALDNIAARLIKEMPDTLILRETSGVQDDEDKVKDEEVRKHTLSMLTERVAADIERRLTWMLNPEALTSAQREAFERLPPHRRPRPLTEQDRPLAREWLRSVTSNKIELTDRIKSGASVVLATCSIAATITDTVRDPADMFDWVIVEEAAKAWPTEVVIPLVLGSRWTLIGDHRQLGAHREEEVLQFLGSLRDNADKDMRQHFDERRERERVLKMFGHLFENLASTQVEEAPVLSHNASPLGRLELQFRMHPTIAEPVGRAFYGLDPVELDEDGLPKSFLGTSAIARREHGVTRPEFLEDRPLVWVDTAGLDDCVEQPFWFNLGEVELIDGIVDRMRPDPLPAARAQEDAGGLVVLTPYRAQKQMLENKDLLRGRVHTAHSFQGREADRVIVSLVRTTRTGNTVSANIGHVGQQEVANVLLSRARRLLVLVGNFGHFAENGGTSWEILTSTIKRHGVVVPGERPDGR